MTQSSPTPRGARTPACRVETLLDTILALVLLTLPLSAQVSYNDLKQANPSNWLHYNGQYNSQRHSLLKQINTANAKDVVPKWMFHMREGRRLEGVPIVVDGVMYVSQPNEVIALDARTGRQIWEWQREPAVQKGPNRGVAVYGNKVFVGTPDAHLVALDSRTGNQLWATELAKTSDGYWSPVAPLVINGKVIMGIAPGDHGLNGFLDAYDPETGERLWRFNTIPGPGEPGHDTWSGDSWKTGGGATWVTGSYDPDLNLIYWGTGNPAPDFDGDVRKGDNLYTESMIAINPDTGKLKWHFQFTPWDVHDWDAVEIPILVDAPYKGEKRKLLVQANRNGYYYVLDRVTGKFLHGTPFINKLNWASGLTPEGRPIRVPDVIPSAKGTKTCPSTSGATNWHSPAYNPDTGWVYVVVKEGCGINTKAKDTFRPGGFAFMATGYTEDPADPWQSYVRALDLTTGKIMWEFKQVSAKSYGPGIVSTAGGLIFAGDDQGLFSALDARSGKALWHFNTGQQISAAPITYTVNGKQYVALLAGSNVVAFGLHE